MSKIQGEMPLAPRDAHASTLTPTLTYGCHYVNDPVLLLSCKYGAGQEMFSKRRVRSGVL